MNGKMHYVGVPPLLPHLPQFGDLDDQTFFAAYHYDHNLFMDGFPKSAVAPTDIVEIMSVRTNCPCRETTTRPHMICNSIHILAKQQLVLETSARPGLYDS